MKREADKQLRQPYALTSPPAASLTFQPPALRSLPSLLVRVRGGRGVVLARARATALRQRHA